jgi:triacylglycerol lipase
MGIARTWLRAFGAPRRAAVVVPLIASLGCVASPPLAAGPEEEEVGSAEHAITETESAGLRSASRAATRAQTLYPIVLCHGLAGWKSLFGVVDYFNGIESALRSAGADVYLAEVPQFDSTEARGEALLAQVENIVARTGRERVNLIGHSHGGLDARYVAAVRPDLIASVTTIGSPHSGAELASYLRAHLREGGFGEGVVSLFANSLGVLLGLLSGHTQPQDSVAAVRSLSFDGMREFNAKYPAGLPASRCGNGASEENGVRFYSWSGTGLLTSFLDPSDMPMKLGSAVYKESSDGLVGKCSAHFGQVIRDDYTMNHLDEVNQLFGLVAMFGPSPKSLFRAHATRLRNAGL